MAAGMATVPLVAKEKPNIVLILADDLGYTEISPYGQKLIETPNLDRLAQNGIRFTRHYCGSPVSAPSRCVLLTGQHTGHAFIRGNHEWTERGNVWNYAAAVQDPGLEGQYPLPDSVRTLPEYLKEAGYRTGLIGKWGLGAPGSEGVPNRQGFDFFYGFNCQRQAHNHYPRHLWKNDQKIWLGNELVVPGTKLAPGADPLDPDSYRPFIQKEYAGELFIREACAFIQAGGIDPFFLMFTPTIPHVALQAPEEWIRKYVAKFGDEKPYLGQEGYFPCRYPHATYAAMVSYLDYQVGELIRALQESGQYDNTLILFTSDNGYAYNAGADPSWFSPDAPFTTTFGWGKGFVHEAGIRVPLIAAWPGKIKPGSQSVLISSFYDFLPTLCEIAGLDIPAGTDGISFRRELLHQPFQKKHDYLYWEIPEYNGQQAVRMGPWKAVRLNLQSGKVVTRLYYLDQDPFEQHDVSETYPDIIRKISDILEAEHDKPALEQFRILAIDR